MFYLTLVRHVPKYILSQNNGFGTKPYIFCPIGDLGIDVGIDVSGSIFTMSSHNINSTLA